MVEPLLDNPRSLTAKVAAVLGGAAVERPRLSGFLNSEFDPFLNQLFAAGSVTPREAAAALEGRPGFIWLAEEPRPSEVAAPGADRLALVVMHGMTAQTAGPAAAAPIDAEIIEVRSRSELRDWHEVYCEVFGGDERGCQNWQRIHDATASRRACACADVVSRPRSCKPPTPPRKRAALSGRSYKRRHRAGRFTPEPDTARREHSQFSFPD